MADALVIGAGPNGLVAAIDLADRGWDVVVLEAQPEPGGAVRSAELVGPGFVVDRFSAFYPLGIASPHLARLDLGAHGLEWCHAPMVLAHPTIDGPAALLSRDLDTTARSLDRFHPGDGLSWVALQGEWDRIEHRVMRTLMEPFPPTRAGIGLLAALGPSAALDLARQTLLPVRRFAQERFDGEGAALLLGGCALHSDLTPDAAASGFFGWLMAALGQHLGWPVPRTGSGALTAALVSRLRSAGGQLRCDARVDHIEVEHGRARGVRLAGGERIRAGSAVIADVAAPQLYGRLVDAHDLPARFLERLSRYQPGSATFKVNWALSGPVPWTDPDVSSAGTVHLAASLDELTLAATEITMGYLPRDPFVLLGQMTTADPTRSPPGTESVWAYTNVPQQVRGDRRHELAGLTAGAGIEAFADRIEEKVECFAPGFRERIQARHLQPPGSFELEDANLVGGDKSLGTAALHQQLIFRPVPGLGRAGTPIRGLFLGSASAHPGGGVHGACGANAARAALAARRRSIRPVSGPLEHVRRRAC